MSYVMVSWQRSADSGAEKSNFTTEKLDECFTPARWSRLTTLVSHADRYVHLVCGENGPLPL